MDLYKIIDILTTIEEGAKFSFSGTEAGQKPGDQVRGKEKAKATKTGAHPFAGRLVGASEGAQRKSFKDYLEEYGMTTGGTVAPTGNTPNTQDPKAQAQQVAKAQQKVNILKTAGVNIPNVNQAVKSSLKDPTTDPVTPQDKQVAAGLGQEVEQLVAKGDPNAVSQLANIIKKTKQQQGKA